MDAVYVCRRGENEELRYSLRSLRHIDVDTVWIVGGWPDWALRADVNLVAVPPVPDRYATTRLNLETACRRPDVSERFMLLMDDVFVMRGLGGIPQWHRGPIEDKPMSVHLRRIARLGAWLDDQGLPRLNYEIHGPMVMEKSKVLALRDLDTPEDANAGLRSLYGNVYGIGGTQTHDFKVRRDSVGWESWPVISTTDAMFKHSPVGAYIRSRFPDPLPYEEAA